MNEPIHITGKVEEIIYSNPENGYTVCDITTKEHMLITATGYMPYITEGETVKISGMWTTHPDYGEQFKVSYCESVMPTDKDAILQYLSSGIVSGVREATAKKLVAHFGTEIFDIMLNSPERLAEIKGIRPGGLRFWRLHARKISESYTELQSMRNIVMFLQQYNISANTAVKVHNALGPNAINLIKENPYILADKVNGISFKTADTIAYNMGIPKNSTSRICAGIKYILQTAAYSEGHTFLPRLVLIEHAVYTLTVLENEVENVLSELILQKDIFVDRVNNTDVYYLSPFYEAEYYIARRLCSLANTEQKFIMTALEAEKRIENYEKEQGISLAAEQKDAVITALSEGCMILTGGPGTGKTTVIRTILELLRELRLKVSLAAPTGRAAKRLSSVTGYEAKTIHRLLGTQQSSNGEFHTFTHNEQNPLSADVIIIDEVSMIDVSLMASFLHAIKHGARVIFSGDADQLPSVGPGNVLNDIIKSNSIPVIKLNKIFRQAEESLIIVNAHKVNRGNLPDIHIHSSDFFFLKRPNPESSAYTVIDLYMNRLPQSYGIEPINSIQVITPTKKGLTGTENLNRILQEHINPKSHNKCEHSYGKTIFREGDKVMQIRNNYDIEYSIKDGEHGMGIYNGDMGIIQSINSDDKYMIIIFDENKEVKYPFTFLDDIDLAYAITVHKSQGSEFPFVIMPVCSYTPQLTSRNLFYTAITRAKDMVVLVGSERVISNMVANNRQNDRFTGLLERLDMMDKIFHSKERGEFSL